MPRTPRSTRPARVYHLISRFVDREWFIASNDERGYYIQLLGRAVELSDWRCFSYAVMSNHIHLGVIAGRQPLDSWLRRVHSPFADWMNRTHDRIGSVFVRGPKDIETPPERVGPLIAYIHNNPVRAGVVDAPGETSWTSHRAYLGLEPAPRWLDTAEGLARAGFDARIGFDAWVRTRPSEREVMDAIDNADEPVDAETLAPATPEVGDIVHLAAESVGIPIEQLCSRRRTRDELLGRRVTVFCAARVGIPGARVARALCMSQQAVSLMHRRGADAVVERIGSGVLARLGRHRA